MNRWLHHTSPVVRLMRSVSGQLTQLQPWTKSILVGAAGFRNRDEYYTACESLPHLHKIRMPMIFLFAKDDPIIPKCLWEPVKEFASTTEDMAFIMTKHGGHLGFIEGGFFLPNPSHGSTDSLWPWLIKP
ncbi:hypothetical protein COOONC_04784 [Cooperia oncophora]